MFRNSYLEMYKTKIHDSSTVEEMFVHFGFIYAAMGSVMQDIEYQLGKVLSTVQYTKENPSVQKSNNRETDEVKIEHERETMNIKNNLAGKMEKFNRETIVDKPPIEQKHQKPQKQ